MSIGDGHDHNCNCYYYWIWELFAIIWLFFLKYKQSKTWFTTLMNYVLTFNYLSRSIFVYWIAKSFRITSKPFIFILLLQNIYCNVTLPLKRCSKSWCWYCESLTWPHLAGHLPYHFTSNFFNDFFYRAWGFSSHSITIRSGKMLIYKKFS